MKPMETKKMSETTERNETTQQQVPHERVVSRPTTANQVRQILMNELGLSRESVRAEMERIIEQTIAKYMQSLFDRDYFEKMAIDKTLEYLKSSRWEKDEIRKMIGEAAKQKATEQFDRIYGG